MMVQVIVGKKMHEGAERHDEAWKVFAGHDAARTVREGFWPKIGRVLSRIPFAEEALAAWYCATDDTTPARVKGMLLAALAYFVVPVDLLPDFLPGLGFTDDLTVLLTTLGLVRSHITEDHRERARHALADLRAGRLPREMNFTGD